MDYVQLKKVVSPYSGEWASPTTKEYEQNGKIVVEAQWHCPSSGKFITRGIVEMRDKQSPNDSKKH